MAKAILRFNDVHARTGLSKSEIQRREDEGTFPQRIPIGSRSVGWLEEEIDAWIDARVQERDRNKAA